MQGTIKKVIEEKGFGFISPTDGGSDIFFHHTACPAGNFKDMQVGNTVTYEVGTNAKGQKAATGVTLG